MPGKLENIIISGECIPEEMMLNYLEGKLTPREMHLVEKHLLECEFCSDAFEGLKEMDHGATRKIVAELNSKIENQFSSQKPVSVKPVQHYYRIAAVIALFIISGATYWYLKRMQEEKMIAQKDSGIPEVNADSIGPLLVPQVSSDQKAIEEKFQPTIEPGASRSDVKERSVREESKHVPPVAAEDVSGSKDDTEGNLTTFNNGLSKDNQKGSAQRSEVSESDSITRTPEKAVIVPSPASSTDYSAAGHKKEQKLKALNMSDEEVASKNYRPAAESVMSADKSSVDAIMDAATVSQLFDSGKLYYELKNYKEASGYFEKLIEKQANEFTNESKWLLANCYFKLHKNAKAKKVLGELVNSGNPFKPEAEKLLKEIQ